MNYQMKCGFRVVPSVALLLLISYVTLSRERTSIIVEPESWDFGHVCVEDGPLEYSFTLHNSSESDVIIKVIPSCSCLKCDKSTFKIEGHGYAMLNTIYDNVTPAKFNKQIILMASDCAKDHIVLTLCGESFLSKDVMKKSYRNRCGTVLLPEMDYEVPPIHVSQRKMFGISVYNTSNENNCLRLNCKSNALKVISPEVELRPDQRTFFNVVIEPEAKDIGRATFILSIADGFGHHGSVRFHTVVLPTTPETPLENMLLVEKIKYSIGPVEKGTSGVLKIPIRNGGVTTININKVDSISPELYIKYPSAIESGETCFIDISLDTVNLEIGEHSFVLTLYSDNVKNQITNFLITIDVV